MYVLHKETIASGLYGKPSIVASESMLKLQTRALKAAADLVALNPDSIMYDRTRKGGVITIRVIRIPIQYDARTWGTSRLKSATAIATWTIRKLSVI